MALRIQRFPQQILSTIWHDETFRFPLLVFVALRLVTAIAALIMIHNVPAQSPAWLATNPNSETYLQALPVNAPLYSVTEPWLRYDTGWYLKNALQGYQPGNPSVVFPPLYPLLIRMVAFLCAGNWLLASLFVSNIACLIAFILFFKLVVFETGKLSVARAALLCLAAFPTAYYLVAGYSEPLYLALTLGAFLAAFNRNWLLAGLFAGLAALTRLQGAVLCLPLAWIAYRQCREAGWRPCLARLPTVVGGPLGALSYLAYLALSHLGNLDAAYEHKWLMFTRFPWDSILFFWTRFTTGHSVSWENNNALALLFIILLGVVVSFTLRPAYTLYLWSTLIIILLRYHVDSQFEGMVRYTLIMFPCFLVLGKLFRRNWFFLLYMAPGMYFQLVLLNNFTHWIWVA